MIYFSEVCDLVRETLTIEEAVNICGLSSQKFYKSMNGYEKHYLHELKILNARHHYRGVNPDVKIFSSRNTDVDHFFRDYTQMNNVCFDDFL